MTQPSPTKPPIILEPRPARPKRGPLWAALGVVALLAGGWYFRSHRAAAPVDNAASAANSAGADAPADPISVSVSPAQLRPVEVTVSAKGTLVAPQGASSRVAATAAGRLARVLVKEGDRVQAGQLLALIDNRAARAGAQSAGAALASSQADARSAAFAVRQAQTDQSNSLRQAQLALDSAIAERDGAVRASQNALRSAQSDERKTRVGARAGDVANALQQARLALRSARIDRDAGVRAARNALLSARTDLAKTQAGARPQEIKQAQAAVAQAQATRDRAATEVTRVQFLYEKGIRAKRDLDDARTALRVADAALSSANGALSLLRAGSRIEDIRAAQLRALGARETLAAAVASGNAKVVQAQSALQLAQNNLGQANLQRPEDVRAAALRVGSAGDALVQAQKSGDAKVAGARAALDAASQGASAVAAKQQDARSKEALAASKGADFKTAQVAASSAELRAPLAGVVSKRNLNPGDLADTGTPVVEISNADVLNLLANLSGEKGGAVTQGMKARVSTSDAPNRIFNGQVVSVGQIDPATNLLSVRVAIPNPGGRLKVGAFATANIVLSTRPLAVVVPKSAILQRDGKSAVLIAGADGKAHQKEVTTGIERAGTVEITSSIKEGDKVITEGGFQLDDGAPITIAPSQTLSGSDATASKTSALLPLPKMPNVALIVGETASRVGETGVKAPKTGANSLSFAPNALSFGAKESTLAPRERAFTANARSETSPVMVVAASAPGSEMGAPGLETALWRPEIVAGMRRGGRITR